MNCESRVNRVVCLVFFVYRVVLEDNYYRLIRLIDLLGILISWVVLGLFLVGESKRVFWLCRKEN